MASDWVKMRTDLYRDPKICVMADFLMDAEGELSRYVNQHCRRDMTVTRNVMRNVTVGALVAVWGIARHRGKRVGDDLVIRGASISVIDDIAELPGFGDAMASVEWAEETEEGVVFPSFFEEFNVEPTYDKKSGNAERQRRFRDRSNALRNAPSNAEVTPKSNDREEKRREEKEGNPPNPPAGGIGPKPSPLVPAPEKAKKPRQQTEPSAEHPIAVRIFTDAWGEKYGAKYPFDGGKHGKAFTWMLDQAGGKADNLRPIIARFLADQDDFYAAGSRHSIDKLRANFARWVTHATPTKQPTAFKSKRDADAEYLASQIFEVMNPTGA